MSLNIGTLKVKSSYYIISAVALTTALSWNTCIKNIIDYAIPMPSQSILVGILYAVVMTLILILITAYLPDTTSQLPTTTKELLERMQDKEQIQNLQRELQNVKEDKIINSRLANIQQIKKNAMVRDTERMANLLYY